MTVFARCAIVLLCAVAVVHGCCWADEGGDAQERYKAGLAKWNAGDADGAIAEWRETLKLKPDSSQTKDMLIKALTQRVEQLENAVRSWSAVASSGREKQSPAGNKLALDSSSGWRLVASWSGKSLKSTEVFHIRREEWAVAWSTKQTPNWADTGMLFQAFVFKRDGTLADPPIAANVTEPDNSYSVVHGAGDYWLMLNTLGADYQVSVYERATASNE